MRFEILTGEKNEHVKIVPSAKFGLFIVKSAARADRITEEMRYFGLDPETIESLRTETSEVEELFELSESGVFRPINLEEDSVNLLLANVSNDGTAQNESVLVESFIEVLPVTPKNIRYT